MYNQRMFAMEVLDPRAGDGMWLLLGLKLVMILKLMTGSNAARIGNLLFYISI
jgi:hypothetical protein